MGSPKSGRSISAMPICAGSPRCTGAPCTLGKREVTWIARMAWAAVMGRMLTTIRSEEHTSELQSQSNLVCRLLLEKKKNNSEVVFDSYERRSLKHKIKKTKCAYISG